MFSAPGGQAPYKVCPCSGAELKAQTGRHLAQAWYQVLACWVTTTYNWCCTRGSTTQKDLPNLDFSTAGLQQKATWPCYPAQVSSGITQPYQSQGKSSLYFCSKHCKQAAKQTVFPSALLQAASQLSLLPPCSKPHTRVRYPWKSSPFSPIHPLHQGQKQERKCLKTTYLLEVAQLHHTKTTSKMSASKPGGWFSSSPTAVQSRP